jgi:uncharacterized protein DUF1641
MVSATSRLAPRINLGGKMTATELAKPHAPVDAVRERLNDPAIAASVVTLLDNAELLSTLVLGVAGLVERGDTIMDSVASGVSDFKASRSADRSPLDLPGPTELAALLSAASGAAPVLTEILSSPVLRLLRDRLNDPALLESLSALLDNAELLTTIVQGLAGLVERGDTIVESVAAGVGELKAAGRTRAPGLPAAGDLAELAGALVRATPVITEVVTSPMVRSEIVALLSMVSEAAAEGAARAREMPRPLTGLRSAVKSMKDPEVARGLGLMVEVAKALGRRMG